MILEYFPQLASLNQYFRAGLVFVALFVILRIALLIFQKIAIKLTAKTSTDLDDILLKSTSKPLSFLALFISLIVALEELVLEESLAGIINHIIYTLIAVSLGFLIFAIVNTSLMRAWKKLAEKTESDVDDTIGQLVYEATRIILIVLVLISILNIWGINIGPLLAGLGIAGLAVALALQPALSNIFSGVAIIMDGTYKVGDVIKISTGEMGVVHKIGLRTTRIKTFDNEMIIVPNSTIANSNVQNFYQPDISIRVNLEFGVEYGVDPEYIKKIAIEEIEQIKLVNKEEKIMVLFTTMADNSLNFKAMFWVDNISKKWPAHQEAITRIYRRLYKEKIGIPFPQRTVWMRDEGKAKSPDPADIKFRKHYNKIYSDFGHEYKEEEKQDEKDEKKENKKSLFKRFNFRRKK